MKQDADSYEAIVDELIMFIMKKTELLWRLSVANQLSSIYLLLKTSVQLEGNTEIHQNRDYYEAIIEEWCKIYIFG